MNSDNNCVDHSDIIESLRYRNADAMKNAMVEEGLGERTAFVAGKSS